MTAHLASSGTSQLKRPIKWLGQDTPDDFELYVLDLPEPDEDDPDDEQDSIEVDNMLSFFELEPIPPQQPDATKQPPIQDSKPSL